VAAQGRDLPLPAVLELLRSPIHEERFLALVILVNRSKKAARAGDLEQQQLLYDGYLSHFEFINNWDLVDLSCRDIVGGYLLAQPKRERRILKEWAASAHLWTRRIAIISTWQFIREGQFGDTLQLSKTLLRDEHDLIHKAVGWMLREVGNRDRVPLIDFLDKHAARMPRTMLRYAIEKLPQKMRQAYMRCE
jgi:3-methyladenine DNA glycosylase AlkD